MSGKPRERARLKGRYLSRTPRKVPDGFVIVHNFIPIGRQRTLLGLDGFRAWTVPAGELKSPGPGLAPCDCGWAGLPHYNVVRGKDF
jgi:hypothetical protein